MALPAPQDNDTYNIEKSFDNEPSDLEKRAVELQRRRALDRKAQQDYLQSQNIAPESQFASMGHPEMDEMPEQPSDQEQDLDENTGDEDGEPGEEDQGAEASGVSPQMQAQMAEVQSRGTGAKQRQVANLRQQSARLNTQINALQKNVDKGLSPIKKELAVSRIADRSKNAARAIRVCAAGFALWYTIIIPLLAILGILGVVLLSFAGFNLGPKSQRTRQLEHQFDSTKKNLEKQRDQRVRPLRQRIMQINRQINTLARGNG